MTARSIDRAGPPPHPRMRRLAGSCLLALAVLAGLAVMAPGAAQAQSRFEGHWSGTWNDPATRSQGTMDLGVAYDGGVRARIDNPDRGFSGDFVGHIEPDGHIDGLYTFFDHGPHSYRATGSADVVGPDRQLYGGIAFFDGPSRIGGLVLTLSYVAGPYLRGPYR